MILITVCIGLNFALPLSIANTSSSWCFPSCFQPSNFLIPTNYPKFQSQVLVVSEASRFFFSRYPTLKILGMSWGVQNHLFWSPRGVIGRVWCFHSFGVRILRVKTYSLDLGPRPLWMPPWQMSRSPQTPVWPPASTGGKWRFIFRIPEP